MEYAQRFTAAADMNLEYLSGKNWSALRVHRLSFSKINNSLKRAIQKMDKDGFDKKVKHKMNKINHPELV